MRPAMGFAGREINTTDDLTSHQELLHPKENMYFERENGATIFRVANLRDTISSLPAGTPK